MNARARRRAWVVATALLVAASARASTAWAAPSDGRVVKVLVPERENLQWMAFWFAKAGGFFAREGLRVELLVPDSPADAAAWARDKDPEVLLLPAPLALELAAAGHRFALVANLFDRDPIDVVVSRAEASSRGLAPGLPLSTRLTKMRGLRVGVAPGPLPRARALFGAGTPTNADAGMDVGGVTLVIVPGKQQNEAFHSGKVDALYAHTPFLERALVDDGAVLVVNQTAGEVPEVSTHQVHALAVAERMRDGAGDVTRALVHAIALAEERMHASPNEVVSALQREFPAVELKYLERIVAIYEPAIPRTPRVSAEALHAALAWYPGHRTAPQIDATKLAAFVDDRFTSPALPAGVPPSSASSATGHAAAETVIEFESGKVANAGAPRRWTETPAFRAVQALTVVALVARIAWGIKRRLRGPKEPRE